MSSNPKIPFALWLVLLSLLPAHAFVFYPIGNIPLRWNVEANVTHTNVVNRSTKAVRYFIASDAWSTANQAAEIAAVRACFDQWQSVPGTNLRFEFAGFVSPQGFDVREDNTNVVYWAKNNLNVAGGQMSIFNLAAWTSVFIGPDGSIREADIVLNGAQFQWFTDFNNTSNRAHFVESVLLHEIGHFVGLDHAVSGGATVFVGESGVSTEAGLSADEIAAMRFLYPAEPATTAEIRGTVRLNGQPVLGAVIVAEDQQGNIANATVSRADGAYNLGGLAPGTYHLRASPLDPANAGVEKLIQGRDIAFEYINAVTSFAATTNRLVTVGAPGIVIHDFNVSSGPPFRISSISLPSSIASLVSVTRHAISLRPGQNDVYVGVSGPNIPKDSVLTITGDGLTVGPTSFTQDHWGPNLNSQIVKVSVSGNATPGLRSFIVTHSSGVAYANGYLEIAAPVPDYNFDQLDDRFQRAFWTPWTSAAAAPGVDPDNDNFSNAFEFRTGTIPTDANSNRLAIKRVERTNTAAVITWDSDLGKRYQLYARDALTTGAWQPIGRAFTAAATEMTQQDTAGVGTRFYRLELLP